MAMSAYSMEQSNCKVIYNGKTYTQSEFNDYKRQLARENNADGKKKTHRRRKTAIVSTSSQYREIGALVKQLMTGAKTCKSLKAYNEWGYRQWGNRCKWVMSLKEIKKPFETFVYAYNRTQETLAKVQEESKRGSKAVYQYVEKLSWNVQDMGQAARNLYEGISKSGVLQSPLADHEMINGQGRRLGLATLVGRSFTSCNNMDNIVKELQKLINER